MNSDHVYAIMIVLVLIILGVITFHYYAFVSAGNGSALNVGVGAGVKVWEYAKKEPVEKFEHEPKKHWIKTPDNNFCPWALV